MIKSLFYLIVFSFLIGCAISTKTTDSTNEGNYVVKTTGFEVDDDYMVASIGDVIFIDSQSNQYIFYGLEGKWLNIEYHKKEASTHSVEGILFDLSNGKTISYNELKIEILEVDESDIKFKILK